MTNKNPIEVLESALNQSIEWDSRKADYTEDDDKLVFTSARMVGLRDGMRGISKDGFNHLCAALAHTTGNKKSLPAQFLREGTTGNIWAATLAEHATLSDKAHMHRTYEGGIEAVVSESWPKFGGTDYENTYVLRKLLEVCQHNPPTFAKLHTHSPGSIVAKIGFREDQINLGSMTGHSGRTIHQGIMLKNGEWRDRSIAIAPFIQTSNCENSTVIDLSGWGFKMPHVGSPEKFILAISEGFQAAIKNAPALVEAMSIANTMPVENIERVIAGLCNDLHLPEGVAMVAMRGIGLQGETVLAVHDALTYAAHTAEISEEDALMTELFASKYMIAKTGVKPKVMVGGERDSYGRNFEAVDHDLQPVEINAEGA